MKHVSVIKLDAMTEIRIVVDEEGINVYSTTHELNFVRDATNSFDMELGEVLPINPEAESILVA